MTEQLPALRGNAHSPFKQAMLGGYDRVEVDEYVARLEQRIEELEQQHSPNGAVQRALEQVGDEVAGILQRAHETAAELTDTARREADERLEGARRASDERLGEAHREAAEITSRAEERLRELDVDTDRIWAERDRIVSDVRELAQQLVQLADAAAARFPPDDATEAFEVAEGEVEAPDAGD